MLQLGHRKYVKLQIWDTAGRQTDIHTVKQTNRQTNKLTDNKTYRQTDIQTDDGRRSRNLQIRSHKSCKVETYKFVTYSFVTSIFSPKLNSYPID